MHFPKISLGRELGSVDKVQSAFEMQENTLELSSTASLRIGYPSVRAFSQGEKEVFVPREIFMRCVAAIRSLRLASSRQHYKSNWSVSTVFLFLLIPGLTTSLFSRPASAASAKQEQAQHSRKYPLGSLSA